MKVILSTRVFIIICCVVSIIAAVVVFNYWKPDALPTFIKKTECRINKGMWNENGTVVGDNFHTAISISEPSCSFPFKDKGKTCSDGKQCASGICLKSDAQNDKNQPATGVCAEYNSYDNYVCNYSFVEEGKLVNEPDGLYLRCAQAI